MRHRNVDPETETQTLRPQAGGRPRKIDRYEIQQLIGRGGMGAVYRAVDTRLCRTVALKTAAGKGSGARLTDRVRQRFLREAMALSKVEHRNVVQVLDFGFADDGTPFLVMEHLRGRDLGALLAAARSPLAVPDAVDIMLGVCAALRACHRVGIIHRDLKPGNIFLAETDTGTEVKVLDFGVSKAPTADELTREGQILGTPQYLAPEQIDGKVGPASDQYALGVLLYVCLTLRLPYEETEDRRLLRAIEAGRFEAPRALRADLPEALEAIVLRAMHVSPGERFESVYALGRELWELASPRAQAEWRAYYHPSSRGGTPPTAQAVTVLEKTAILEGPLDGERPALTPPASEELRIPRRPHPWTWAALVALVLVAAGSARWRAGRSRSTSVVPRERGAAAARALAKAPAKPSKTAAHRAAPAPAPDPPASVPAPPPTRPPLHRRLRARRPSLTNAPPETTLPTIDHEGIGIPSE
ncbi:MAG TPA: serine/threonine-protein kinase [Polyangia bacterium]|nr:serine/threonine-protein kinase [Polyangia bacterium]